MRNIPFCSFSVGFLNEAQSLFNVSVMNIFSPVGKTIHSFPKRMVKTLHSRLLLSFIHSENKFFKQAAGQNQKIGLDKRISGSNVIDDALQDLLQYIIRDYVENWYGVITKETEFLFETKQFLQKVVVHISNR